MIYNAHIDKVLIIGLGGAGQRLLRVIHQLYPNIKLLTYRQKNKTPLLDKDFNIIENEKLEEKYKLKSLNKLEEAILLNPNIAFICNPTSLHIGTAMRIVKNKIPILIEKPLGANLKECRQLRKLAEKYKIKIYVNYQRRFHPLIHLVKNYLFNKELGQLLKCNIEVLTDARIWHPYEDYRTLYAFRSELGGGVLLTECHEIDLIQWLVGIPDSIFCSTLYEEEARKYEVETAVMMKWKYNNLNINFKLDMVNNINKRTLDFYFEFGLLNLNLLDSTLMITRHGSTSPELITIRGICMESQYQSALSNLINSLKTGAAPLSATLSEALNSVLIIDAAKTSLMTGSEIFTGGNIHGNKISCSSKEHIPSTTSP